MTKNNPVFIVGGGPSLKEVNLDLLRDKTTICVNKSFFEVPFPNYFITHDLSFFNKITATEKFCLSQSPAKRCFVLSSVTIPYMEISKCFFHDRRPFPNNQSGFSYPINFLTDIIISLEEFGIGLSWSDFRHGENSGFSALQFAVLMGFNPIYLLGFDLVTGPDSAHWHTGYGESILVVQKRLDYYINNFLAGYHELRTIKPEINVVSCSPISRLNSVYPYKNIDEVLNGKF